VRRKLTVTSVSVVLSLVIGACAGTSGAGRAPAFCEIVWLVRYRAA
jgi:hypothetical protein